MHALKVTWGQSWSGPWQSPHLLQVGVIDMWQAQASTHFQYLKSSNTVCNSLFHGMTGSRACLWNWRWWKSHLIFIEGYSNQYDRRGSIGGRFRPSTQPEWPIIQKPHWRKWRPNTQHLRSSNLLSPTQIHQPKPSQSPRWPNFLGGEGLKVPGDH